MQIVILGLGKMGSRIAKKLANEHEVIVWNRTKADAQKFVEDNPRAKLLDELSMLEGLKSPKIIWLMLPAGEPTTEILYEIKKHLSSGDTVVDGGNSFWKDTDKRFAEFNNIGINYLGIGVSGGIIAEKDGYPLMVGGSQKGYEIIKPILETLSRPYGGYEYFGEGGAGHFVKMVHNGMEYAMMQGIGEGFDVLKNSPFKLNLIKVAKLFSKGTVISGFLMARTESALTKNPAMNDIVGIIDASGEAQWTVDAAKEEGVEVPAIEQALDYRLKSQKDEKIQNSFTAKLISALRREFGGHEVKKR